MSSDARVWKDEDGNWHATHDGQCYKNQHPSTCGPYGLGHVIQDVEFCMGAPLRWEIEDGGPDRGMMLFGWTA